MKVLVFGGSFSPPTLAHEEIIKRCLKLPGFDEVWLMPSADRADKIVSAPEAQRLEMLLIVKEGINSKRLKICDIEYRLPKPTFLAQTKPALQKEHPNTEFWFVFGGDAYNDMPNWPQGERLQKELNLVIFSDSEPKRESDAPVIHIKLHSSFDQISSTKARKRVNLKQMVSQKILTYINDKALFR